MCFTKRSAQLGGSYGNLHLIPPEAQMEPRTPSSLCPGADSWVCSPGVCPACPRPTDRGVSCRRGVRGSAPAGLRLPLRTGRKFASFSRGSSFPPPCPPECFTPVCFLAKCCCSAFFILPGVAYLFVGRLGCLSVSPPWMTISYGGT